MITHKYTQPGLRLGLPDIRMMYSEGAFDALTVNKMSTSCIVEQSVA